jgi:hypothetical protein
MNGTLDLFFCYSHKDETLRHELERERAMGMEKDVREGEAVRIELRSPRKMRRSASPRSNTAI